MDPSIPPLFDAGPSPVRLLLLDSIAQAAGHAAGQVVIGGSHGGASVVAYTIAARPLLAVFNDAGIGKDEAGVAALPALQAAGIAACTVSHASACIGDARSTLQHGVISRCNGLALQFGARPGLRLRDWLASPQAWPAQLAPAGDDLRSDAAGSSPARR